MNFYELREKYDSIIYKKYNCIENDNEIKISFLYKLGEHDFEHVLVIPKKYFFHLTFSFFSKIISSTIKDTPTVIPISAKLNIGKP